MDGIIQPIWNYVATKAFPDPDKHQDGVSLGGVMRHLRDGKTFR
jgi:hypothetical protein